MKENMSNTATYHILCLQCAGTKAVFLYDQHFYPNDILVNSKYYDFKSIISEYARFIRQLLFPDHGFG
jgi:hypothetical protein